MQKHANDDSKRLPAATGGATQAPVDLGPYRIADPEAFGRNILRLMEEGTRAFSGFMDFSKSAATPTIVDWAEASKVFSAVAQPWLADPARLVAAQGALFAGYMQLMANASQRAIGGEVAPVAEPDKGDNRFADPEWNRNPYFDFWKQLYLITARWLEDVLDK